MNIINVKSSMCYSPLSIFEFRQLEENQDEDVIKAINNGNIYLICKRPRLFFKSVSINHEKKLSVDVIQQDTLNTIAFEIPLIQKNILTEDADIEIQFGTFDYATSTPNWQAMKEKVFNGNEFDGLKIYKITPAGKDFVVWLNPEKLMHLCFSGYIKAFLSASDASVIKNLVEYEVLYIGRSKDMMHRQLKHEHVQEILSKELTEWGSSPNFEVSMIVLKIDSGNEECINSVPQDSGLKNDDFYKDLEKALVRNFLPKYNKDLFDNYPLKGTESIYPKCQYNYLIHDFSIPVNLKTDKTVFYGLDDVIVVKDDGSISQYSRNTIYMEIFQKAI